MKHPRLALIPVYLVLCLILGGASNAGFWANLALQLIALAIIVWSFMVKRQTPISPAGRQLLGIAGLIIALICIQLIPLPPELWTSLPGRAWVAEGFRLLGQQLPWMPISLAPYETLSSALWLLPAFAVLIGILRLGYFQATWIAWSITAIMAASVLLGALQITNPESSSPYYFYDVTNLGIAVGFFSNANHMATLLVATIPLLAALFANAQEKSRSARRSSGIFVILAGSLAVVVVGIVINTSLAGLGLMVPVLAGSVLLIRSRRKKLSRISVLAVAGLAIMSVALVLSKPFDNNLIGANVQESQLSRYTTFTKSLQATQLYMPVGSGVGTFVDIYPRYENPAQVNKYFINHVHGDYIEVALETGVPGLLIIVLFLLWWARRTIAIWGTDNPDHMMKAATIATAAILAHSVVDYPLRTAAISALFAACCALMAEPRPRETRSSAREGNRARHLSAD